MLKLQQIGPLEAVVTGKKLGSCPCIVLFHGYGASAFDLVSLSEIPLSFDSSWIFPNGPFDLYYGPGMKGQAWFPIDREALDEAMAKRSAASFSSTEELQAAAAKVHRMLGELGIPLSQVILGGFSQGAMLAVEAALTAPEQIAGLALFSGICVDEERWKKLAHLKAGLHFFQSHGLEDTLLPLWAGQELYDLLTNAGLKGKLHTFHGGHTIPEQIELLFGYFVQECFRHYSKT